MIPQHLNKKYDILYPDPPWEYDDKLLADNMRGGSADHYNVEKREWIASFPVERLAKDNSRMYMWTTGPMLADGTAYFVMKAWGFIPKTVAFVWRKMNKVSYKTPQFGLGRTTRSNYEFVILGIRGKGVKRIDAGVRQEIVWPVGSHSCKPILLRDKLVRLHGDSVSYIELFHRIPKEDDWRLPMHRNYENENDHLWAFTGLESYDEFNMKDLDEELFNKKIERYCNGC